MVSRACLVAGGYVHGILPGALAEAANEPAPAPDKWDFKKFPRRKSKGEAVKSIEGTGQDLLEDVDDNQLTVDIVGTMHEVRSRYLSITLAE